MPNQPTPNWNQLKRPFREALIDAFNSDSLEAMLRYPPCNRELEHLTGKNQALPKIVDDVMADAVRHGWLEELSAGALRANGSHAGLKTNATNILAGIKRLH